MARHNIQFRGIRHAPSDITGQDGDLLECVNLVHEGGELKPIEMPEETNIEGVDDSVSNEPMTLAAVHNLVDGKKFVFVRVFNVNGTTLSTVIIKDESNNIVTNGKRDIPAQVLWVEAIGNTLVIGTDKHTQYAYYKNTSYKWLGGRLPQPVFEFDLEGGGDGVEWEGNPYMKDFKGNTVPGGGFPFYAEAQYPLWAYSPNMVNNSEENRGIFADNVQMKIAKVIQKNKNKTKFLFPFFVRYAVKLYDGSYVMHSSPILMLPSTDLCPFVCSIDYFDEYSVPNYNENLFTDDVLLYYNISIRYKNKRLKYRFKGFYIGDTDVTSSISEWEDIIKGVDLFLSSQIVTYNNDYLSNHDNIHLEYLNPGYQGSSTVIPSEYRWVNFDGGRYYAHGDSVSLKSALISSDNPATWPTVNFGITEDVYVKETFHCYVTKSKYYPLPSYSLGIVNEKIENTNLFYKVKGYKLERMKSSFSTYLDEEVEDGLIERLETLPTLPDDYLSRSLVVAGTSYNYNQKLVIGNLMVEVPQWYRNTGYFNGLTNDIGDIQLCFVIEKQEKTVNIRCNLGQNQYNLRMFGHFIFFPDVDCKRLLVEYKDVVYTIPMFPHDGLNGAYAVADRLKSFDEILSSMSVVSNMPDGTEDRFYSMPNTIAMSSVANPFNFPVSNFKDIGRTKILGIAANTLDVSSGQWGQYPLHVFCEDGIVAVSIDAEGKFGGSQAVSADVLIQPRGISQPTLIQTGQSLVFVTQRGLMEISGTKIACISEVMEGRHFNPLRELYPLGLKEASSSESNVVSAQNVQSRDGQTRNVNPSVIQNIDGLLANYIVWSSDDSDFKSFANGGFLAYDYAHNRILVVNGKYRYQYVYNLRNGLWSKEVVTKNGEEKVIVAAVNNYTELYLQCGNGKLYKAMDVTDENVANSLFQYGYFISRPVRFGTDEYKTITRILHRYTDYADGSYAKLALYGSRDGVKYGRVNTLRGMGYQYFIFVVYTYLKPNERYSYMSVDFETRLTNKLR